MGEDYKNENDIKVNVVKVLARAATDPEYYKKLRDDPTKTLNEAGIAGKEFYIPDEQTLKTILCILECLGNIIEKRV
jgi:hypothetical protein